MPPRPDLSLTSPILLSPAVIVMLRAVTSAVVPMPSSSASMMAAGEFSVTSDAVERIAPTRRSPVFSEIVIEPLVSTSMWCWSLGPAAPPPTISVIARMLMSLSSLSARFGSAAATMMLRPATMPGRVSKPLTSWARMSYVLSMCVAPAPSFANMPRSSSGAEPSGVLKNVKCRSPSYPWPL